MLLANRARIISVAFEKQCYAACTYWVRARRENKLRVKMVKDAHLNGSHHIARPSKTIYCEKRIESLGDLLEQVATKMVFDP
jgi:hypothetical protein